MICSENVFSQLTCWLSSTNLIRRGTHGFLCFAQIDQVMLHMALYLEIMLLKPFSLFNVTKGILQRVTISKKVHHILNETIEIKKLNLKRFFCQKMFFYCGY